MTEKSLNGSGGSLSKDDEKGAGLDIQQMRGSSIGDVVEMVDTTHGQFHRSFTPHQVHVSINFTSRVRRS